MGKTKEVWVVISMWTKQNRGPAGGLGQMGDLPQRIYPTWLHEAWNAPQVFTDCYLRGQQRVNDLTQCFAKWTAKYCLLMALPRNSINKKSSLGLSFSPQLPLQMAATQICLCTFCKILILSQLPGLPSPLTSLSWSSLSGSFCGAHCTSSSCISSQ